MDEIGSDSMKVLFDIYFQQQDYGNILGRLLPNLQKVGHFHAAGSYGRHELPNGELNYPYIFNALDQAGYQGYTALEYFPLEAPVVGIRQFL